PGCTSLPDANPPGCPNHSPPGPPACSPGGGATPRSATREPPSGCPPAAAPASRSAPTSSPNAYANSASAPPKAAPPHCLASPPNFPPQCSPGCPASTSRSQSPGNTPPLATGPPTPPTTAAAHQPPPKTSNRPFSTPVSETHSDSWNNRVHQVGPAKTSTAIPTTSSPPTWPPAPDRAVGPTAQAHGSHGIAE